MSLEANKSIVTQYVECLTNGDIEGTLNMMTEDGQWWIPGKPEATPLAGWKSKETMGKMLAELFPLLKAPSVITIYSMVAEGDKVAVEAESHGEALNGRIYNNQYHFLFVIRDGKVQKFKEYGDTLHTKSVFVDP